jgi:hypothetical protein
MTDPRKTIREALQELDRDAEQLASYRVTTEDMLGIKIPESEGRLQFARCLMRAFHDGQAERDQLRAELQRIQAAVPLFPAPKDPVAYIQELLAELCPLKTHVRQMAEQAEGKQES